jgi:putative tricarboxylic transport membrane protein
MRQRIIVEGMIFSIIGLIGLYEGIRLTRARDLTAVQDSLGPAGYIIMIGLALIIAGATHIVINYKKDIDNRKVIVSKEEKITLRMVITIYVSLVVYCLLINFIGYLFSSLIFFLMMFQIFGFKWFVNAILSVVLSLTFYLLFEYLLTMSFPKGMLF